MKSKILYADESYAIIGACFNVYKEMGCGFLEAIYQECLEIEFSFQKIPFEAQKELQLKYRGQILKQTYKPDFFVITRLLLKSKRYQK